MNIDVLISNSIFKPFFHKEKELEIYLTGHVHSDSCQDQIILLKSLFTENSALKNLQEIINNFTYIKGNFSFVIKDKNNKVLACVDKVKSFPLFYSYNNYALTISNDPYAINNNITTQKNEISFLEYKMAGYVTGKDTLFTGTHQLQAGEFLYYNGNKVNIQSYYLFYNPQSINLSKEKLIDKLHEVTCFIFKKLINKLNGRTVFLALSAGLDSRLILCMLKYLGYKNIKTFSYGIPDNWDAKWASLIAGKLGVEWFSVPHPYTRKNARNIFFSNECKEYFNFSHLLSAIPFMQDFYALSHLKNINKLPSDSVIINGQTGDFISGNHISDSFNNANLTKDNLLQAIINKHYSLWTNLHSEDNLGIIKDKILSTFPVQIGDNMDKESAMKLYELWEWRERQCKYVINGQRAYDFFKLSWELPLWDDAYLDFWRVIPFKYKFKQLLYREYLNTFNFYGLFKDMKICRYNVPRHINFLRYFFWIFGKRRFYYRKKFLSYWQDYSYLYSLCSYNQYLKYAKFHRNAISYFVKYFLEERYDEKIF